MKRNPTSSFSPQHHMASSFFPQPPHEPPHNDLHLHLHQHLHQQFDSSRVLQKVEKSLEASPAHKAHHIPVDMVDDAEAAIIEEALALSANQAQMRQHRPFGEHFAAKCTQPPTAHIPVLFQLSQQQQQKQQQHQQVDLTSDDDDNNAIEKAEEEERKRGTWEDEGGEKVEAENADADDVIFAREELAPKGEENMRFQNLNRILQHPGVRCLHTRTHAQMYGLHIDFFI